MLTRDIKKTIDNARNVLVGKIPNPQAQIEQITIAMIYKFMDDMDIETVELGGNREFFVEELSEYAWSKIMSPQLGNEARMNLYTEALDKLQLSNRIPKLFRDIFKGAYLPFRDGQTLTLFLKEINDLSYSNSENLGNGFEYLLSIMGSQGDAGQFRTPRHIIDFIVDIVKPAKSDTILDPACGTAGFLISAYKYIQKTAEETKQPLTPQERTALTENIQGYDISPDMQKLALVNMYLHKFKDPKIYEYDTLTQDTRWDNYFDCILANPPFMTPKGGIQPHNKFGVKANRSEVLFVDYIMEHLNSTGRAGIIVPEGIVFQSANAYKELRKKLVDENYLYAVVSLPSGVFNPYSGVKTTILLLDRQLAKKTDKVLFVEIQNDGFDLGAQRRETPDKNDLPKALEFIHQWQNSINTQTEFTTESKLVTVVEKSKLAENEEYNLTASRYKVAQDFSNCKWDIVKVGDICETTSGGTPLKSREDFYYPQEIPWINSGEVRNGEIYQANKYISRIGLEKSSAKIVPANSVLVAMYGATAGQVGLLKIEASTNQAICSILPNERFNPKFLYYVLSSKTNDLIEMSVGGAQPNISQGIIKNIEIPLPPLDVQEEIVKELDGYQAVIDGAQKVIDNWKPTLPVNPNWEKTRLGDICEVQSGGTPLKNKKEYWSDGSINWYSSGELNNVYTNESNEKITPLGLENSNAKLFPKGSLLVGMYDTAAFKMSILDREAAFNQAISGIKPNNKINMYFLYLYFTANRDSYMRQRAGVRQQNLNKGFICDINIPIPPIEEQKEIVSKVEEERIIIEECKKLIELHQDKINSKIKSIWGDGCE
ncbi:restriction endonuclease subunit S [bacterium]|nr:restriction endonuclease subunit S [bacterium]